MLATIKQFLAYAEWLALVIFIAVFGWLLQSHTLVGALVTYALAILMFWLMFHLSSKKYSSSTRISANNYLGNPILDIVLIIVCFWTYIDTQEWTLLGVIGILVVGIDFVRWLLSWLK